MKQRQLQLPVAAECCHVLRLVRRCALLLAALFLAAQGASAAEYALWVNGTQVTDGNKNDILAGNQSYTDCKISFDGDATLTLHSLPAMEYDSQYPFIQSSLSHLTIYLEGENTVGCDQFLNVTADAAFPTAPTFTFATDVENPGSLVINATGNSNWYEGYTLNTNDMKEYRLFLNPAGYDASYVPTARIAPLKAPSIYATATSYGHNIYNIEGSEQDAVVKYAIDYVEEGVEDIGEAEFESGANGIPMNRPGTLTAWVEKDGVRGLTATGYLFGVLPKKYVFGEVAPEFEAPELVPVVDGVTLNNNFSFSNDFIRKDEIQGETEYETVYEYSIVNVGRDFISANVSSPSYEERDYVVISDTIQFLVEVLPEAPTVSLEGGAYRGNQEIELLAGFLDYLDSPANNQGSTTAVIKYTLSGGDAELEYGEPFEISESTTLTAWVEASVTPATGGDPTVYSSESVTAEYTITQPVEYGLTIITDDDEITVNEDNAPYIYGGDDMPAVSFDGNNKLILNGATLTGIIVRRGTELNSLTIYLIGNNTVNGSIRSEVPDATIPLHFATSGTAPGTLTYTNESDAALSTFNVTYDNKLVGTFSNDNKTLTVKVALAPVTAEPADPEDPESEPSTTEVDMTSTGTGEVSTENLSSVVIDNILYTLHDTQKAGADDDGYATVTIGVDDVNMLVLNSEVDDDDLAAAMNEEPGSEDYLTHFQGLTFMLTPGTGDIKITSFAEPGHALCVKIGTNEPVKLTNATLTLNTIPYACAEPTYVYIYHQTISSASAPALASHRIGPKATVSTGMSSLSVSASIVDTPPAAVGLPYKLLDKESFATSIAGLTGGLTVGDASITDLPDDMFISTSSSAPRRAGGDLIIPENTPYIDLTATSITDMDVKRNEGPFNGVPENVFIYMPAGNTSSAKNVVIGSVCPDMQLNGAADAKPFSALKNFTATNALLNRSFEGGITSTVYLPYAITNPDNFGTFYGFDGVDLDEMTVSMTATKTLAANTPYIFEAKAGGVESISVNCANVVASSSAAATFKGTFERVDYSANMYCYAAEAEGSIVKGQFVKMGTGSYVPPFRAYIEAAATAPAFSIIWTDANGQTTGIMDVEDNVRTGQDVWYMLNGLKLKAQPTAKGVYIHNGKKEIVK